ncbi:hypothetical protein [Clostridium baratii]|uniref:hypothetical protein n=1 Tax=Clostridium baratii TaxID=1561 RepID=UPI0005F2C163|nr:hypothetical protein [Clostridium baratii]AQM58563.1 hypothetical protein NPD11_3034 [Clostridium baratii]KJU71550.1 hypothetical protein UC77_09050 [Clostridium baratii]
MIICKINKLNPKKAFLKNSDIVEIDMLKYKYHRLKEEFDSLSKSLSSVKSYTDLLKLNYKPIDTNSESLRKMSMPNPCINKNNDCRECKNIKATLQKWRDKCNYIIDLYSSTISILNRINNYYNNECKDAIKLKKTYPDTDLIFIRFGEYKNGYTWLRAVVWNCTPLASSDLFRTIGTDLYVLYGKDSEVNKSSSMSMLYHLDTTNASIELCEFNIKQENVGHGQFALISLNEIILAFNKKSSTPINYIEGIISPNVNPEDTKRYKEAYDRLVYIYKKTGYLGKSNSRYKVYRNFEENKSC